MNKSPAFQFYPNDWLSSPRIMLMTPAEEGAYIRLLSICWMDGHLPNDDEQLAKLSRLGKAWFDGSSTTLRKCFAERGGKLYNERLSKERGKQLKWKQKCREGGVKSGKLRKQKALERKNELKGSLELLANSDELIGNKTPTLQSLSSSSKYTIEQVKDFAFCLGIEDKKAEAFYHHYHAQGWLRANGQAITNLNSQLINWRKNEYRFEPKQKRQTNETIGESFAEQKSSIGGHME